MHEGYIFAAESNYGSYRVADVTYSGRPARVLYSGDGLAAQSGVALDGSSDMLFDYNQRLLELVRGMQPRCLLLIGGGACTLPRVLSDEFPTLWQDIVEQDQLMLDIAVRYFDFKQTRPIRTHITDGREFLNEAVQQYDLVIIDAFDHAVVPVPLRTVEAMQATNHALRPGGVLAINYIAAYYGRRAASLKSTLAAMQAAFPSVSLYPASTGFSLWTPQNFILTAQADNRAVSSLLRYPPLALPHTSFGDVLHDAA